MIVKYRKYFMFLIILVCSFLVSCNNPTESTKTSPEISETEQTVPIKTFSDNEIQKYIDNLTNDFYINKDDFKETTFVYDKNTHANIEKEDIEPLYLYMGLRDTSHVALHLVGAYRGYDWIFFNKAQIKTEESIVTLFDNIASYDKHEEVLSNGKVYESYDLCPIDGKLIRTLKNLDSDKSYTLRFTGKDYYYEYEIKPDEVKSIQNTITCYEQIKDVIETRIIPEPETEAPETEAPETEAPVTGKLEAEISLSEGTNEHSVNVSLVNKTNRDYLVRCTINLFDNDGNVIASKPYETLIASFTKIDEIIIFDELDKEATRCDISIDEKKELTIVHTKPA